MNKLIKNIPVLIMLAMIIQFFVFSGNLFEPQPSINTDYIFLTSSNASAGTQKVIVTIFLIIVLCMPTYLSESKILSYIYCGIVIVGTFIFKEMFFAYMTFVLSIPSMLIGGIVEFFLAIIRFIFPKFNGAWIAWIFQLLAHLGVGGFLTFPAEILKESAEETATKKSSNVEDESVIERTLTDFVDGMEEIQKEQREKEKIETLKDIEYHLKNLDHKK